MSEIHETIEKAHEGAHDEFFNKRIALLIAVLALFLSFSETLGKSAQTEAISANVETSDLWAFFQAKNIRKTQVDTAAEEMKVAADAAADPTAKTAMQKQIDSWKLPPVTTPSPRPAKAAKNSLSAPRRRKKSETWRWQNTITMSLLRPRFRSASYSLRRR